MKNNRILLFIVFALFVFFPFNVNAEELVVYDKIEITLPNPETGEKPSKNLEVVYSNENERTEKRVLEIEWVKVDMSKEEDPGVLVGENDVFETGYIYAYVPLDENEGLTEDESIASDAKQYVNGIDTTEWPIVYFKVDGVKSAEFIVDELVVGKTLPTTMTIITTTDNGKQEMSIAIEWYEEEKEDALAKDYKAETGKTYTLEFSDDNDDEIYEQFEQIGENIDFRTTIKINNKVVNILEEEPTFTPIEEFKLANNVKNTTLSNNATTIKVNENFTTTIVVDENYILPSMVYVLVGGNELNTSSYVYDATTGKLTIPANMINGNITLEGKAGEKTFKVIFDANGGNFKDGNATLSYEKWVYTDYNNLETPTRDGYNFLGYYTEKAGGTSFDSYYNEAGVDKDMTLYARWEKNSTVATPEPENPQTYDGITVNIIIGCVSLVGLISAIIYFTKRNKVRV